MRPLEKKWLESVLALAMLTTASGCANMGLAIVWAEREDAFRLESPEISQVVVASHNGQIEAEGRTGNNLAIDVVARVRGGGLSDSDASACLEAIEIVTPVTNDGKTQEIGWRWRMKNHPPHWQIQVAFEVKLPAALALRAESHNGRLVVRRMSGDCDLHSHNAGIEVIDGGPGELVAESHNGPIDARSLAPHVELSSHNGSVSAELLSAEALAGHVDSHNGSVRLALSPTVGAELECASHNASVQVDLPLENAVRKGRKELRGRLGPGGQPLVVESHNGSIEIVAGE